MFSVQLSAHERSHQRSRSAQPLVKLDRILFFAFPPYFTVSILWVFILYYFLVQLNHFIIFATFEISISFHYRFKFSGYSFFIALWCWSFAGYIHTFRIYNFFIALWCWSFAGWNIPPSSQDQGWQRPPKLLWENFSINIFPDFSQIFLGEIFPPLRRKCQILWGNILLWEAVFTWYPLGSMISDHILWCICLIFLSISRTDRGGRR